MKELRTLVLWSHLVLGLTAAIILGVTGFTGTLITVREGLSDVLDTEPAVTRPSEMPSLVAIVSAVESHRGQGQVSSVELDRPGAVLVSLRDGSSVFLDPGSLTIVGERNRNHHRLSRVGEVLVALHANLMLGMVGRPFVLFVTFESLLLAASGLWLWWRKKHWRFAWKGSPFRVSWDLHNATGIWFLVPLLAMSGTAMVMAFPGPFLRAVGQTGTPWLYPPAIELPADYERLTPVGVERALAVADSASPGPVTTLGIPAGNQAAYRVEKASAIVWVERFSGAVASVQAVATPTDGDHTIELVNRVHTGEEFGLAGEVVMALGSLMLALMAVTGLVLGWKRLTITFGGARRRDRTGA